MADEPNGRYASFREFSDFREEARLALRALEGQVADIEKEFKLEVASAMKAMTRQLDAMQAAQRDDRRWKLSTLAQMYGPILTGIIAIVIAVLK